MADCHKALFHVIGKHYKNKPYDLLAPMRFMKNICNLHETKYHLTFFLSFLLPSYTILDSLTYRMSLF